MAYSDPTKERISKIVWQHKKDQARINAGEPVRPKGFKSKYANA